MAHLTNDQIFAVVFLILAGLVFTGSVIMERSLIAGGLLLMVLAFLLPLLVK
jgi:hypothetical protein